MFGRVMEVHQASGHAEERRLESVKELGYLERGPRYKIQNRRLRDAVERKRGRVDLMDLREELALLEGLNELLVRGLDPWEMRRQLEAIAGMPPNQGALMKKTAQDAVDSKAIPAGMILDLVKEIRNLSKTVVDMEVTMRKAWTQERVQKWIEDMVGIVRRHVHPDQMERIGADFREKKGL